MDPLALFRLGCHGAQVYRTRLHSRSVPPGVGSIRENARFWRQLRRRFEGPMSNQRVSMHGMWSSGRCSSWRPSVPPWASATSGSFLYHRAVRWRRVRGRLSAVHRPDRDPGDGGDPARRRGQASPISTMKTGRGKVHRRHGVWSDTRVWSPDFLSWFFYSVIAGWALAYVSRPRAVA